MLIRSIASVALAASFTATPLFAHGQVRPQASPASPATNTNVGDPNEKICENITLIGSRLASKRFCGTRAEWEDRKLQDKQALERAQMGPCVRNGTTCK